MALAHAILTALLEDDLSGSELARDFARSRGLFWQATHQQIYQELHRLAEKRLLNRREVATAGGPPRIVYGLTRAGREALAAWVAGASRYQPAKDELLLKLYSLDPGNAEHLAAEITARREETMRQLYLFEKIRRRHYTAPTALPVRGKGVYLALSLGIRQGEMLLAWCDEALALIAGLGDGGVTGEGDQAAAPVDIE